MGGVTWAGGRRHLSGRAARGGFLVRLLHARFERLDAFGEITHDPGQLAGAEQDQDNGQDDQPMHQTHRTHIMTPETENSTILTESALNFAANRRFDGAQHRGWDTRSCRFAENQA